MSTDLPESITTEPPYPKPAYAWWVASALSLIYVVSYIDRQALNLMIDMIKADLGVSDTRMGMLAGSFGVFYAFGALPFAHMADSKSRRAIISFGIFGWTIMCATCGFARTYWVLFMARIGLGVGESSLVPGVYSILGDYLPREKLPRAMSVFQIGAIAGTGLAFFIVGWVIKLVESSDPLIIPGYGVLFTWQETFLYVAAPGVIALLLMLTIKEPLRRGATGPGGHKAASTAELIAFYKTNAKTIVTHHVGFSSIAIMIFGFIGWMAPYFGRVHGVHPGDFGIYFGLMQIFGGSFGVICAALLAEHLTKRGFHDANVRSGLIGAVILVPLTMLTLLMPTKALAYALLIPAATMVSYPFGIAHGALPGITPPNMRARVGAIYNFVHTILGMALGLTIPGLLTDYVFTRPEDVKYSLMVMIGFFGPIGITMLWLGLKPYARSYETTGPGLAALASST